MILTPITGGTPLEIRTEFDGYYYLANIPLGKYTFAPDPEQLQSAGLVAKPQSKILVLENLDDFPKPEDFDLIRLTELDNTPPEGLVSGQTSTTTMQEPLPESPAPPQMQAAMPVVESNSTTEDVSWFEATLLDDHQSSTTDSDHSINPAGDGDADGVLNHEDVCNHTGRGSQVNEFGCVYVGEQLSSIAFTAGSANLNTQMAFELNGLARELRANPSLQITIETHTDNTGDAFRNMDLSKRRARSIIKYLHQTRGVSPSQLSGIAMGEARPTASNRTPDGRRLNRRVVIKLRSPKSADRSQR